MLQRALSFVLAMSAMIIWLKTHETDPTESRIKLPQDTFKIEQMLTMQDILLYSYLLGIQVLFHWNKQAYENQNSFGCNTDSQNISKHIKIQELATSRFQKMHQAFSIIFNDMLEHQQFRIIMTSKYNMRECIPSWIGVGAHGQKWESSLLKDKSYNQSCCNDSNKL